MELKIKKYLMTERERGKKERKEEVGKKFKKKIHIEKGTTNFVVISYIFSVTLLDHLPFVSLFI